MTYAEIRREVGTRNTVTNTWLQTRFNLRYTKSRAVIESLISDGVLRIKDLHDGSNTGYLVVKEKTNEQTNN